MGQLLLYQSSRGRKKSILESNKQEIKANVGGKFNNIQTSSRLKKTPRKYHSFNNIAK